MNPKLVLRMKVWLIFYVLAVMCGLNMFAHSTFFWVTIISAIAFNKRG